MPGDPVNTTSEPAVSSGGVFATTRWSVVLCAQGDTETGREALETLCRTYWFPVYALVWRQGFDPNTARDFTQEFFARLLSRDGLATARHDRGRFRAFLAQSVRNSLCDEWDKARAQKRGGGQHVLSLDAEMAEGHYLELAHGPTPAQDFDRRWAEELIAAARVRLHSEFDAANKGHLLTVMDSLGDADAIPLARHAEQFGLPLNTLKSHLHRARLRHAEIIRELIAETVETPMEVEAELRHLLAALSG